MTTRTIAGHTWRAIGPSLYEHVTAPIWIGYDSAGWRIAVRGIYGAKQFATLSEAAGMIQDAFERENLAWTDQTQYNLQPPKPLGPIYPDLGANVAKHRRAIGKYGSIKETPREERLAYAAAIEKSIRSKQRTMHARATPPTTSGRYVPPSITRLLKYDAPLPMVGDPPFSRSKGDPWDNRCKALFGMSDE